MKVGVIGTGAMGTNHIRVYNTLKDRCQLTGIFDTDYERASQVAADFGVTAFRTVDELLERVEAVSVTVPTSAHFEVGALCADRGIHVLIEKPMTETLEQGEMLIHKANKSGVVLQVGHIELFNPTINVMKNILANEEIIAFEMKRMGPPEARNRHSDVVMDLMIHDLYILLYLLEEDVERIHALGRIYFQALKHVSTLLQFHSGIIANLTASQVTEEKVRTLKVVTKDAFIQADLLDRNILISRSTNFLLDKASTGYRQHNIVEKVIIPTHEPLRMQLIHFIESIQNGKAPKVAGSDGLRALLLAERIRRELTRA
ncbi:Gfo/Idh/MocA family oxidoreductase [Paenibacillus gansuensis]|uniref:Gfo/Idh/MocA family oxidoreductase n=1 Tax=Paenibacillus gansuensis TaxID=306542 RepID=A0ABW5PJQ0_9BACL